METGKGRQTFGWGHYLTESEQFAREYAEGGARDQSENSLMIIFALSGVVVFCCFASGFLHFRPADEVAGGIDFILLRSGALLTLC